MLGCFSGEAFGASYKTLRHMVNPGEDIHSIALRYGVGVGAISADNEGVNLFELQVGQRLEIRRLSRKQRASDSQITEQWRQMRDAYLAAKSAPAVVPDDEEQNREMTAEHERISDSGFKIIDDDKSLEVALMLPLKRDGSVESQFVGFYRGALIAVDELKKEKRKVSLKVYNTARSEQVVGELIAAGELKDADLIIGPVFAEPFKVVAEYAAQIKVPIVSPLAVMDEVENPYVFQAPVSKGDRYDQIKHLLSPDNNVVVVSGKSDDNSLLEGLQYLFPSNMRMIKYDRELEIEKIEELMTDQTENVFVVLPNAELEVDEILARLSSVQNNLIANGIMRPSISIIGSSRWLRFVNIDRTMFFKLRYHSVASYHADRGNNAVRVFDDKYLKTFGTMPSLYSYRGYDVAKMFVYGVGYYGAEFVDNINELDVDLLQTPYNFERDETGKMINTEWVTVRYGDDFNIRVINGENNDQEIFDFQRIDLR